MTHFMKIGTWFLLLIFMLTAEANNKAATATSQHQDDPKAILIAVHDKVIAVLERDKEHLAKDPAYMEAMLDQLVSPHIDYKAMGALMLGAKHWKSASKEQQQSFVREFRAMLIRIYGTSVALYDGQKLEFADFVAAKNSNRRGHVSATVAGLSANSKIDFFLRHKKSDGWKIYDISVQGISMVKNYRSTFQRDLESMSIKQLIEKMAQRGTQSTAPAKAKPN